MANVLKELLHGSGECATRGWSFLTLGIPNGRCSVTGTGYVGDTDRGQRKIALFP